MDLLREALVWLADGGNWAGPTGITARLGEHLMVTAIVVALACLLAMPIGVWAGHRGRGGDLIVGIAGAARALPTLGLLTLAALALGIGLVAPVVALVVLAIPPVLNAAYSGIATVQPSVTGAARAVGMSSRQVLAQVQLPLATPVLLGGVRSATLQVIATATLAAYTSNTGLGRYIFAGLKANDYPLLIAGSLLVVVVALVVDALFAVAQRFSVRHR
ncbi:ABC transporter permease [Jonesia quinghaiensis]|uniref:ABC transporter permease n=1 Tax=Jonesia quinghaiensis TaxID=262806 RepID=UPI00041BE20D|nr:ABC transporter permease subunit [Jonesia quinghaiensis]